MSTAPGRILGKPSVKALRKRLSGRVAAIQIKLARSAPAEFSFQAQTCSVEHRPVRALDPMELRRTDPLRFLIQACCFFSGGGATGEAAAAPAGAFVGGSLRNLPILCGTSAEVMKL